MPVHKSHYSQHFVGVLLIFYIGIRFFFSQWIDSFGGYASYYFEIILTAIAALLFWQSFKKMFTISKTLFYAILAALLSGFLVFKGAGILQITIPFDLTSIELRFFLLVVAPLLEELVFRFFCWQPVEKINRTAALLFTSALFSYSHFHSFWFVPPEYQGFIYYQTGYTLFLGLACGYSVFKYNSLLGAILIHFAFNLGFFLSSVF